MFKHSAITWTQALQALNLVEVEAFLDLAVLLYAERGVGNRFVETSDPVRPIFWIFFVLKSGKYAGREGSILGDGA